MKNYLYIIVAIVLVAIMSLIYYPVYKRNLEIKRFEKEGARLIKIIEQYRKVNHKLPKVLNDIKLPPGDFDDFGYDVTNDSANYVLGFNIGIMKDHVYESDTGRWTDSSN